jgi:hypothetical protein
VSALAAIMRLMLTIYIDADACPVKDEVYRVALVAYAGQDLTSVEQLVKLVAALARRCRCSAPYTIPNGQPSGYLHAGAQCPFHVSPECVGGMFTGEMQMPEAAMESGS